MSSTHRANEGAQHLALKIGAAEVLQAEPYRYFARLFEAKCCDAVLFKFWGLMLWILALEVQMRATHVLENCRRDFPFSHAVLVVTPNESVARAVIRKIATLTRAEQERVSVAIYRDGHLVSVKGGIK